MLHDVDGETRVLSDINTFVSITDEKGADFSSNQTIRVLDQIANDIAVLFGTKYLGKVPTTAQAVFLCGTTSCPTTRSCRPSARWRISTPKGSSWRRARAKRPLPSPTTSLL